jgi:type IV pilus assembly protein PilX
MVLLIGMILLLVLTAVAAIGFRNVTMSERMAGNAVDRNVSFQASESASKEALDVIDAGNFNATTLGHYDPPLARGGDTAFWTQGEGPTIAPSACAATQPFSWKSCAAQVATTYANNAKPAQYVIEKVSSTSSGGSTTTVYRITTRSTGGSDASEVILQTLYSKTTTP